MFNEMKAFSIIVKITVLTIFLLASVVNAVPTEEWNKTYGDISNVRAKHVQQTSDGGYILAGYVFSSGSGYDALLIKTDENGNEQWRKKFGEAGEERAESVQQTLDGGYILIGYVSSSGIGKDALVIKTDANGNQIWNKTFGDKGPDELNSVIQISDGSYILAGKTYSYKSYGDNDNDGWIIKIDSNGDQLWNKTFGELYTDKFNSVQKTSDGGYILAGMTQVDGNDEAWLIKTDINGKEQWSKRFKEKITTTTSSAQQTTDSGYILVGYNTDNKQPSGIDSRSDVWIIKTDVNGNEQWKKTFGGTKSDASYSIQQTLDSGYILAGSTESYGAGNSDAWLIKADVNGNEKWNMTFGSAKEERAYSVQQTKDGSYILAGYKVSSTGFTDAWLIKVKGENSDITKTPTANPTEIAELTKVPTVSYTEKVETTKSPTAVPTEKASGFEVVLTIAILSVFYIFIQKRR